MYNLPNIKKIFKNLNILKKQEEKLIYLIELGKILPIKRKNIRKKKYIIYGCQSNVWIKIYKKKNKLIFNADSNSSIIKGFLTILISIYNNKKITKIFKFDLKKLIKKKIIKNIIFSRIIGIKYIIKYIKNKINYFNKK